jgi:hypothetical protein
MENPFHRNFKGFNMIQFCVTKDHVGKFSTGWDPVKILCFPPFQKGVHPLQFVIRATPTC